MITPKLNSFLLNRPVPRIDVWHNPMHKIFAKNDKSRSSGGVFELEEKIRKMVYPEEPDQTVLF